MMRDWISHSKRIEAAGIAAACLAARLRVAEPGVDGRPVSRCWICRAP